MVPDIQVEGQDVLDCLDPYVYLVFSFLLGHEESGEFEGLVGIELALHGVEA